MLTKIVLTNTNTNSMEQISYSETNMFSCGLYNPHVFVRPKSLTQLAPEAHPVLMCIGYLFKVIDMVIPSTTWSPKFSSSYFLQIQFDFNLFGNKSMHIYT